MTTTPNEGLGWNTESLERMEPGVSAHEAGIPFAEIKPVTVVGIPKVDNLTEKLAAALGKVDDSGKKMTPRGLMEALIGDTVAAAFADQRCIKPPLGCGEPLPPFDDSLVAGFFKDETSWREYKITARCQTCQDQYYEQAKKAEEALERGCEGHPGLGDLTEYCDGSCNVETKCEHDPLCGCRFQGEI